MTVHHPFAKQNSDEILGLLKVLQYSVIAPRWVARVRRPVVIVGVATILRHAVVRPRPAKHFPGVQLQRSLHCVQLWDGGKGNVRVGIGGDQLAGPGQIGRRRRCAARLEDEDAEMLREAPGNGAVRAPP